MPGEFTHIALIEYFLKDFNEEFCNILKKHKSTYKLGSLSPDLFYFSYGTHDSISDKIHEYQTNSIPHFFFKRIRESNDERTIAFLMGYLSHIVADGVFHPFVDEIVGEYETHKSEHTQFERELDILICKRLLKREPIIDGKETVIGIIKNGLTDDILKSFTSIVNEVYDININEDIVADLFDHMDQVFTAKKPSLAYDKFLGLYENCKILVPENILALPKHSKFNKSINIFDDCVPLFLSSYGKILTDTWRALMLNETSYIVPAINLTTGYLPNSNKPFFWTT